MSVSMVVDQKKFRRFDDYAPNATHNTSPSSLQYKVNPRTQLRIVTLSKEQTKLTFDPINAQEAQTEEKCEVCNQVPYTYWSYVSKNLFQECASCCMLWFIIFHILFIFNDFPHLNLARRICLYAKPEGTESCFQKVTIPLSLHKSKSTATGEESIVCSLCLPSVMNGIPLYTRTFQILGLTIEVSTSISDRFSQFTDHWFFFFIRFSWFFRLFIYILIFLYSLL